MKKIGDMLVRQKFRFPESDQIWSIVNIWCDNTVSICCSSHGAGISGDVKVYPLPLQSIWLHELSVDSNRPKEFYIDSYTKPYKFVCSDYSSSYYISRDNITLRVHNLLVYIPTT